VLSAVRPLPAEEVPLDDTLGRVLAEDVTSADDLPPWDNSAMDGFAVGSTAAGELPVVGEARAGAPYGRPLAPGEAVRISTGAPVPAGAAAVVPVERTEPAGDRVAVPESRPGENIRRAGEDVRAGDVVLRAGATVGAAELAVLAAIGRAAARCSARPRVAVLATGDELVEPGEPLGPGQIRNSNTRSMRAQALAAGAAVVTEATVPDDFDSTRDALAGALETADVVCVSGGVSVGAHDHVKPALAELGVEERFWRVALKPGKPTWFGVLGDKLVFGLPGNPVSAMVTFHLFARPALRALQGAPLSETRAEAVLDSPLPRNRSRDEVVRCRLHARDDGWHVEPTGPQGSHVLSSMVGAGALALVEAGEGQINAGERVPIELLTGTFPA
jgi:molybdopterin molybdotransferase